MSWSGGSLSDPAVFWELSGDLFSVHDSEGRYVDVNPAYQRVLGWEREQLLGRRVTDFLHPDDLAAAEAAAGTATDGPGRVMEAETRCVCADGSYRWLLWSAYTNGDGWCGVGKDITERKEAEAARDRAQARAADAYAATGLSTWLWDPAKDHVDFGGEQGEHPALGPSCTLEGKLEMVEPSYRALVRQAVTRVAEGLDESYCLRYPSTATGETVRWVESRGVAERRADGSVAVVGTTQDVTEAELARQELVRSRNFAQATLDSLDAHVAVLDENGAIVSVNGAWSRFASENGCPGLGVGESYLAVCDAAGAASPEAAPVAVALRQMLAGSLSRYEVEYPCHSTAEERWFTMTAVLHRADGPARVVVQHHNITERVRADRRERLRARLLDEVDAAVIATDLEATVTLWSRGAEALYGWTEAEALGRRLVDLTVPTRFHDRMQDYVHDLRENAHLEGDLKLRRKDGSCFTGFVRSSVVCDGDEVPVGLVGVSVDATERVEAADDLRRARDYLSAVIDGMGEGLVAVDQNGAVLYMNATAETRLGWSSGELVGRNFHETVHARPGEDPPCPATECPIGSAPATGEPVRVDDDRFYRRDGSFLRISCTSSPIELGDDERGAVLLFADITERKRAEWALQTSEAQLKSIVENTGAAIYVKRRGDYRYLLGNPEFERILKLEPGTAVGMRDEDLVSADQVQTVRETDRRVIEEGAEVTIEEELVAAGSARTYLTVKFPLPDEHGEPYALCGISTDITDRKRQQAELSERAEWEERIRAAVNEDRLLVYAQPIIDLGTGAVVQEELLVRMQGSEGGIISPADFLPQAERFGLVGQIDRFMVHRGIRLAAEGRSVEINLSGRSIGDRALTREIERELRVTGADPSKIVFEITETAAVEDIAAAGKFSQRIARLGCRCALDDFGTGYGSLTYQRNLAVQYLKIDISFVRGMASSPADQQVVRSIVKLADDYGQQTVAEGVEDERTLEMLREFGVHYAQGYHIGRPRPADG